MSFWLQAGLLLVTVVAAAVLPLQAGINASLGKLLGHPLLATIASFTIGTVTAILAAVVLRVPWPNLAAAKTASIWLWSGGAFGVVFVTVALIVAPKIGAAAFAGAVIAGQLVAGLLLDYYGVAGFGEKPITLMRVLGVLLVAGGVLLVHLGSGTAGPTTR